MKSWKKTFFVLIACVAFLLLMMLFWGLIRNQANQQKPSVKRLQTDVDIQVKGFVFTDMGDKKNKLEVKAEKAVYDRPKNVVTMERVQIVFTSPHVRLFQIKADQGHIFTDTKKIEIQGGVVMTSSNGDTFYADYLAYDNAERKVFTDAPVTLKNKKMEIKGKGLNVDLDKGVAEILSGVEAVIKP